MKKLLFLSVLLFIAILFTACGESRPDDLPVTLNDSAEHSVELISGAGSSPVETLTFRLSDFSNANQWGKKWISKVEATSTSYIEVTGITAEDVEMKNVTLSAANKTLSLGTITTNEKFMIDSAERLGFMQSVMDQIYNNGSSNVVLKYTSTNRMIDENAKLTIRINSRFSFN